MSTASVYYEDNNGRSLVARVRDYIILDNKGHSRHLRISFQLNKIGLKEFSESLCIVYGIKEVAGINV
jgi:hypothetical protein